MLWNVDTSTRSGTFFACKIAIFEVQEPRSRIVVFGSHYPERENLYGCYSQAYNNSIGRCSETRYICSAQLSLLARTISNSHFGAQLVSTCGWSSSPWIHEIHQVILAIKDHITG